MLIELYCLVLEKKDAYAWSSKMPVSIPEDLDLIQVFNILFLIE